MTRVSDPIQAGQIAADVSRNAAQARTDTPHLRLPPTRSTETGRFEFWRTTAAEHTLQFTLAMKWARLVMAIVTSLAAGAVAGWISPSSRWAPWIVGIVVLAMFLPVHIAIWSKFPVWYHLTFLLTIIPAVLVGALLPPRRNKDLNGAYSTPR